MWQGNKYNKYWIILLLHHCNGNKTKSQWILIESYNRINIINIELLYYYCNKTITKSRNTLTNIKKIINVNENYKKIEKCDSWNEHRKYYYKSKKIELKFEKKFCNVQFYTT